ncbi:Dynein Light Chain Roadblock-Type 2 [Manis pentadactyla]|nr:Dynein Light Chain Roadblock-Type 2 [Manis pentadactyla]
MGSSPSLALSDHASNQAVAPKGFGQNACIKGMTCSGWHMPHSNRIFDDLSFLNSRSSDQQIMLAIQKQTLLLQMLKKDSSIKSHLLQPAISTRLSVQDHKTANQNLLPTGVLLQHVWKTCDLGSSWTTSIFDVPWSPRADRYIHPMFQHIPEFPL